MDFSKWARQYAWMTDNVIWQEGIAAVAKQLPPSASSLRLLDVACGPGHTLRDLLHLRPDISPVGLDLAPGMLRLARMKRPGNWLLGDALHIPAKTDCFDALLMQRTYYFLPEKDAFLREALRVLRPGGRLIMVDPVAKSRGVWRSLARGPRAALDMSAWRLGAKVFGGVTLEGVANDLIQAGFARVLSEPAFDDWAVLSRGEKPGIDIAASAREGRSGRYVHLLIRQQPNLPVWKLPPGEKYQWQAVMNNDMALAFSSLPQAVEFMQAAVLAGTISDVNKVAKFRPDVVPFELMMNPSLEDIQKVSFRDVDPTLAEAPDE
jgi:SAM-dependent methyltransferase